jgi:hypothetical protein
MPLPQCVQEARLGMPDLCALTQSASANTPTAVCVLYPEGDCVCVDTESTWVHASSLTLSC